MEFVTEYIIMYTNDGDNWQTYSAVDGSPELFKGNTDGDSVHTNYFDIPIIARWIRINPTRWRDRISMRIELYGCLYVSHTVNFDGNSFVVKDLKRYPVMSQEDKIQFRFRTNHMGGVILYSRGTQGDIFALQLIDNQLLLNIDLGGGIPTSMSVGSLLDDYLWHDVSIIRDKREISFTVDRLVVKEKIRGDFSHLDLNREIYIGGLSNFNQEGLVVKKNFTGCMENFFINDTNVFEELPHDRGLTYQQYGISYSCWYTKTYPVNFRTSSASIKILSSMQSQLDTSFEMRTFNEDGILYYNDFTSDGFVKLFLDKGKIKIEIQGKDTPKAITIEPFDEILNDGKWHSIKILLNTNKIELHVDGKPSITTRKFSLMTGANNYFGGYKTSNEGFVGCMRLISMFGTRIQVNRLVADTDSPDKLIFDACNMVDRCNPNPCEHGGICKQNSQDFFCVCPDGYVGEVCHIAKHPLSCEAYRLANRDTGRIDISIDVDGSGPLEPFKVTCEFPFEEPALTILHHKHEYRTEVKGFPKPGSFIQDIIYNAEMDQIVELVNRSYICKQHLGYECLNSNLFNTPVSEKDPFLPFSWWVSRNNQKMDYWGGSLPGTRKCSCGLYGTCVNRNKWCNCDAEKNEWHIDEGEIIQKEYLPVRQLRFGDTGLTTDNKKGRYMLGPLECSGDYLFDNIVTFRYEDATIELPTFDFGHSGDIYFQFKTTAKNGVFVHIRGPVDFIKIVLVEEDHIQFQYRAGHSASGAMLDVPYKINDNNWHSVLFERNRKEAKLILDGNIVGTAKELVHPVRAFHFTSNLVIGASIDYREGYVGCIRAFMLNGKMVDLLSIAERGQYGISPGCVGKCMSNPCLNNGTCLEGYSGYTCDCQWTAFKGPICADEIGVTLHSDQYIRYDFENSISTLEEYIRVGFTTTDKTGMILGISSTTGEYLNLMMSASGHLRLVFDFGFERQEIIIRDENFALGQVHDIIIQRSQKGSTITIKVDNYAPKVITYPIDKKADAQFNGLKSIYVGRNETMGTGDGFVGCISKVQFEDHFPLRRAFQEGRRSNLFLHPETVREDNCGIEPVTYPPERSETRPTPTLPPGVIIEAMRAESEDAAILGGVLVIIFLALVLMAILIGRYMSRHKGEYRTHEDTGAKDAPDADTAVIQSKTGHGVPKKKEWFI
ncbi:neurexin-4 isoform X3 [Centruroides vittatus]